MDDFGWTWFRVLKRKGVGWGDIRLGGVSRGWIMRALVNINALNP